ncbi:hypothetical protein P7C73_g287, partial [Tremellales sp. Uapishka_1]
MLRSYPSLSTLPSPHHPPLNQVKISTVMSCADVIAKMEHFKGRRTPGPGGKISKDDWEAKKMCLHREICRLELEMAKREIEAASALARGCCIRTHVKNIVRHKFGEQRQAITPIPLHGTDVDLPAGLGTRFRRAMRIAFHSIDQEELIRDVWSGKALKNMSLGMQDTHNLEFHQMGGVVGYWLQVVSKEYLKRYSELQKQYPGMAHATSAHDSKNRYWVPPFRSALRWGRALTQYHSVDVRKLQAELKSCPPFWVCFDDESHE